MSKTVNELGSILADMYSNAPKKEQVTMIHLFCRFLPMLTHHSCMLTHLLYSLQVLDPDGQ